MKSAKNFIGLGVLVTVNLALQFAFQWVIVLTFGAGTKTDAFLGAMALPQFILTVLSGSLTMVLMPLMAGKPDAEFRKESWSYFQAIGLLFTVVSAVLLISSSLWTPLLLPGFKGDDAAMVLNLTRIQLVGMVLSAILSVVWAVNSARNNFFFIETTSIIANVAGLLLLYVSVKLFDISIYSIAWISIIRVLLQVIFLMRVMGSYQKPDFHAASFKETWKKLKPLMAGNIYYKTDTVVDRNLTSNGSSGELTILNLAQQVYGVGNSIFTKVFVNTMIPGLAKAHTEGNTKAFNAIFKKRLLISITVAAAVFLVLFVAGKWIANLGFSFKNFKEADINRLWWIMVLLGGYWAGAILGSVVATVFYAKGDTVTPTRISIINFTLYLPIKVFCYYKFGIAGLALSVTTYYMLNFLTQLFFLRKHLF